MTKRQDTAIAAPKETEAQFQRFVRDLALTLGWKVYHARYSLGSDPGWPDLFMVRERRIVVCELKAQRGKVKPAQLEWLEALRKVDGAEAYLWWPQDRDEIQRVLR